MSSFLALRLKPVDEREDGRSFENIISPGLMLFCLKMNNVGLCASLRSQTRQGGMYVELRKMDIDSNMSSFLVVRSKLSPEFCMDHNLENHLVASACRCTKTMMCSYMCGVGNKKNYTQAIHVLGFADWMPTEACMSSILAVRSKSR